METNTIQEIDLHRLIMRFDHTRVMEPGTIGRLRYSIERFGQLSPVIVNLEGTKDLILMDGYKRVQAIKGCCKDTVFAEIWNTDEHTTLLRLFSENQLRNSKLIEESLMLREMQNRYKLSMRQIAHNIGRDVAWVSRRLDMVNTLPDDILDAVRKGDISAWSASRILAPLARANTEHARHLVEQLKKTPLSTRELNTLYKHYKKSNKSVREKIIKEPALFIKSLKNLEHKNDALKIYAGPEGTWLKDIKTVNSILGYLHKNVTTAIYPGQDKMQQSDMIFSFKKAVKQITVLNDEIERIAP
jgi:ParB family chromosome partitioning protein